MVETVLKTMDYIFCMDVDYRDDYAIAAGILFQDWESDQIDQEQTVRLEKVEPYKPGQFYKRELPCLTPLINSLLVFPTIFIVDGYVYLGSKNKPGLGAYLYKKLEGKASVIGVAKNNFNNEKFAAEVFRGTSQKPLFVTSEGMENSIAANHIKSMHGDHRIPTILKRVDQLCREK